MIKLFLTDVDGCLTDGGMYYSAEGEVMKRFCVYDGMGMVCLQQAGIPCGILTSENSPLVKARAEKLKLRFLYLGVGSKVGKSVTRYDFSLQDAPSPSLSSELHSSSPSLSSESHSSSPSLSSELHSSSPSLSSELHSSSALSGSRGVSAELPPMSKLQAAREICAQLGITLADVCYVGDDINDIDLLREVGSPCCPSNARPEVKGISKSSGAKADIRILDTPGGQGAIRELADLILDQIPTQKGVIRG